ncbi:hypothetical protein BTH38_04595 [Bacillus toyonensis]|uniref:phage major capsid protein n=1 Tax=Bacillus toyonensis TaxID=155322 RepID=UPI000A19BA56|nr:phage major capsid protein [Bacillus toyonensis]OSM14680.1 hypothetical protein BTH38_04595 [Bacillus toyonensis]
MILNQFKQTDITIPFVESAKNFPYITNQFDMFRASSSTRRYFFYDVEEGDINPEGLIDKDLVFKPILFEQETVSASIKISQKMINDTPIDVVQVAKENVIPRLLRKLQNESLGKGNADGSNGHMQSIFEYNNYVNKIADIKTFTDVIEMYDDFIKQPENLIGAICIVKSAKFVSTLVDVAGQPIFKAGKSIDGAIGTIFGDIPVLQHDLNGKADMVLMKGKSYAISIDDRDMFVNSITKDTPTSLGGYTRIFGEMGASGMVVNPYAIKILNPKLVQASVEAQSVEIEPKEVIEDTVEEVKETSTAQVARSKPKTTRNRKVKGE